MDKIILSFELVPPPPIISSAIPHYNKTDNKLIDLDIEFHEAVNKIRKIVRFQYTGI